MASPAPRADGSASLDPTAPLGEDADVNADAPLELNYGSDDDDDGDDDASVDHDAGLGASGTELSHRTGALMSSYRDFVHALEEGTAGIEGGEAAKAVLEGEAQVREGGGEKAAASAAGGGSRDDTFGFRQFDRPDSGLARHAIVGGDRTLQEEEEEDDPYHGHYHEDGTPRILLERKYRHSQAWLRSHRVQRGLAIIALTAVAVGIAVGASKAKKAPPSLDWNKELSEEVAETEKHADEVLKAQRDEDESNGRDENAEDAASAAKTETVTAAAKTASVATVAPSPNTPAPSQTPQSTLSTTGADAAAAASGPPPTPPKQTAVASADANAEEAKLAAIHDVIVHAFDPVLYDRRRGWQGRTHDEAARFCADAGALGPRVLCPFQV